MLLEISIKNFVIIKEETINFESGLNIITGETGSGKSLIIDCISALCGGKFAKENIRTGESRAFVQALFYIGNNNVVKEIMNENGITEDIEDQLVISREINENGRTSCRVNGQIVTLTLIKRLTQFLVDIIGQNEHQLLFNINNHINFLDQYGHERTISLKEDLKILVNKIKLLTEKLNKLNVDNTERERRIDLLNFQIDEINKADLKADEEEVLKNRRAILIHAEKLYNSMGYIYDDLYNGINSSSVIDKINSSINHINEIISIDDKIYSFKSVIESALYSLDDIKNELRNYRDNIEFNDGEVNEIEERLHLINKLKRKYGNTIKQIIDYKNFMEADYNEIINSEQLANNLLAEIDNNNLQYKKKSKVLSSVRLSLSKKLEREVEKTLNELNMEGAKFIISIASDEDIINPNGIDKVEFLLSSNPGEIPKSLIKIASGGEISRVLLSIKYCLLNNHNISCLVFDEVDAGIGGLTADIVGKKLKSISQKSQGICITHLPQIACYGDNHIQIQKIIEKEKTYTLIKNLSYEERIIEISRMLSGNKNIEMSLLHAKALLEQKRLP